MIFQHVTTNDAGPYKCVSKGLKVPNFYIKSVDLVVKKDWEELWESDTGVSDIFIFNKFCSIKVT